MRLDEIQPSAAEQRVKRLKASAKAAKVRAKQLKAQADTSAERLEMQKSRAALTQAQRSAVTAAGIDVLRGRVERPARAGILTVPTALAVEMIAAAGTGRPCN